MEYELIRTETFDRWFSGLEKALRNRLLSRFARLETGHFGDCKAISENLFEMRFFFGGGLRVYFTKRGRAAILLLSGGGKDSQENDIKNARRVMDDIEE